MTLNEITAVIAENFDRELDMPFRLQLMERVKIWRSRLVANALQKHPAQRPFFRQTVYLKMIQAQGIPCAPAVSCVIATTKDEVPLPVRVGSILFDYVGGVDGKSPFRCETPGTGNYLDTGEFTHLFPSYLYTNRKITTHKEDLPMIRVDGVFDDPWAALKLSCDTTGEVCDTWNTEFPVSGDLLQLIIQNILYVDYRRPAPEDDTQIEVTPNIQ